MSQSSPKIVYITAGAGGMYCGSCMRDNALAGGLQKLGWDVTLLPLYTPIRVDEEDHSVDQVFFGGINVFLQQKIPLFRHLPRFLDHWLDNPALIRRVSSGSISVKAKELGEMTLSMVKGEHGFQKKETVRLVEWLKNHAKPDLVCLSNLLVGGSIPALKRELNIPVLVTLQGDDVFLDELEEPWKSKVLAEMKRLAEEADGFITFSEFYRGVMSELLDIPREKFHLTPLGIQFEEFDEIYEHRSENHPGPVIGYFARICPEKGFDILVDAFLQVASDHPDVRLRAGGWLSDKDSDLFQAQIEKIGKAGLEDRFEYVGSPDHDGKIDFFKSTRVFCVPARFVEPKGLYLLEAMASGLPSVVPDRGALYEMMKASGAGLVFDHGDVKDLADHLSKLVGDEGACRTLGQRGRTWVEKYCSREVMASETAKVFEKTLQRGAEKP